MASFSAFDCDTLAVDFQRIPEARGWRKKSRAARELPGMVEAIHEFVRL
ncbi:MAG: hypothetical protein HY319_07300 [Armatimonadetes bacterium]|nr:hypothetical protein [Armatimonadota bacterium]